MKGVFVRIQENGLGWNENHKSFRPPKSWRIGDVIDSTDGTRTDGLAAFHLQETEFTKFMNGENFVITDHTSNPDVIDWDEIGRDEFLASDALQAGYEYVVFAGETIEQLPDGWIVKPLPINEVIMNSDFDLDLDEPLLGGRRRTKGGESAAVERPLLDEMQPSSPICF